MHPVQPLVLKFEIDTQNLQHVQNVIDQCNQLIADTELKPCPSCGGSQHVKLAPWTHPNPEHDDTAIVIQCDYCDLQTKPQYWFISSPESAVTALQAAFGCWNTRPKEVALQ